MKSVRPQLLVSVRNADEALAAQRGLAEIIDVKEPLHGSLGRADASTVGLIGRAISKPFVAAHDRVRPDADPTTSALSVAESAGACSTAVRSAVVNSVSGPCLSLALGEVTDWAHEDAAVLRQYRATIRAVRPAYLKLGLAGLTQASTLAALQTADWEAAWSATRRLFPGEHQWVAVAYADSQRAHAPTPAEVCEAAVASQCRVLLLDTFLKDSTTLLDWQSKNELLDLRENTQRHGMLLALAGRVSAEVALQLLPIQPDIIGVRGAVCVDGERKSAIDERRIVQLRRALGAG